MILFLFDLIVCSELIAIQPPQCLGSSKSAEREDELEPPPDKRTSSKSVFISKDADSPHEKVSVLHESSQCSQAEFLPSMLLFSLLLNFDHL